MAYYPPKARTWHLRGEASNITGYQRLVMLPQTAGVEGSVSGASSGSTETLMMAFSSDVLGVSAIAAGTWRYVLAAKVDSATDVTTIKAYAYSRDADGVETLLYSVSSAELNNTAVSAIIVTSAQAAFTVDITDRLIIKFYAVSNSASAKTVTLYYQGATNYSTASIPDDIPVRTGDMAKDVYDQTGEALLNVNGVRFATDYDHGDAAIGQMDWNSSDGTVDLHLLNNSTNQIGQELSKYGKASATITNGDLVMFDGAQGDHIKMKPANATVLTSPHLILGIATQNIANNAFGYVTWMGKVNGVYTPGWAAGEVLYVSPTTYQPTNIQPTPTFIAIGSVIKAATGASENGIIDINPGFLSSIAPVTTHFEVLQDSAGGILADGNGNIIYVEVSN